MVRLVMSAVMLGWLGACASDQVRDGARAACEAQHVPEQEFGACLDRMEGTLQAARNYRPPTTPPNQPNQP